MGNGIANRWSAFPLVSLDPLPGWRGGVAPFVRSSFYDQEARITRARCEKRTYRYTYRPDDCNKIAYSHHSKGTVLGFTVGISPSEGTIPFELAKTVPRSSTEMEHAGRIPLKLPAKVRLNPNGEVAMVNFQFQPDQKPSSPP